MCSLGRYPSTFDPLDWNLSQFVLKDTGITEREWKIDITLDQGKKPYCVGYSMAHYGICLPTLSMYTSVDADFFYKRCKIYDLQPGMENGTTLRSGANVGMDLGMWKNYAFATDADSFNYWLLNEGPIIVGTNWLTDMFYFDENNVIHCTGDIAGGHAYLAFGKKHGFTHFLTSWPEFGDNGKFWIPDAEFWKLFKDRGEALTAVEIAKVDPSVVQSGCRNTPIGKALQRIWG